MEEHRGLMVSRAWTGEEREHVALLIERDIFELQEKGRALEEAMPWQFSVCEEICKSVDYLSRMRNDVVSADSNALEANRERYKVYLGNCALGS